MKILSGAFTATLLLGLAACGGEPGLWENTSKSEYAPYCTIEFCDSIETQAEPECTCPCEDDSDDDCVGDDCPSGGGDDDRRV